MKNPELIETGIRHSHLPVRISLLQYFISDFTAMLLLILLS